MVSELEAWLARHQVTPLEAFRLGAGEPCEHPGQVRRSTASEPRTPVISRPSGYIVR